MSDSAGLCVMAHRKPEQAANGLMVCEWHGTQIVELLEEVVELYALAPELVSDRPKPEHAGGRTKRPHSPALANLDVVALTDPRTGPMTDPHSEYTISYLYGGEVPNVAYELSIWSDHVAAERQVAKPGRSVTEQATFLRRHHAWLCAQDSIGDYARDLRTLRGKLSALLHMPRPKLVGHCFTLTDNQECGAPLYLHPGQDAVHCGRCDRTYTGADLLRLKVIGTHEHEETG